MGLAGTFAAILHAVCMGTLDWDLAQQVLAGVVPFGLDCGSESKLTEVPPVDVGTVYPRWLQDAVVADRMFGSDDASGTLPTKVFSLKDTIATPGFEHISFNALRQITNDLPGYSKWFKRGCEFMCYLIHRSTKTASFFTCKRKEVPNNAFKR